jgi:hypothetical protein|nr:hypothetical protein [uncultured Acetatifactor sp.]
MTDDPGAALRKAGSKSFTLPAKGVIMKAYSNLLKRFPESR